MIFKVFSMFDSGANAYLPPFYAMTADLAKRNLSRAAQLEPVPDFALFPDHFVLFELGTWDGETGVLSSFVAPVPVLRDYCAGTPAGK